MAFAISFYTNDISQHRLQTICCFRLESETAKQWHNGGDGDDGKMTNCVCVRDHIHIKFTNFVPWIWAAQSHSHRQMINSLRIPNGKKNCVQFIPSTPFTAYNSIRTRCTYTWCVCVYAYSPVYHLCTMMSFESAQLTAMTEYRIEKKIKHNTTHTHAQIRSNENRKMKHCACGTQIQNAMSRTKFMYKLTTEYDTMFFSNEMRNTNYTRDKTAQL